MSFTLGRDLLVFGPPKPESPAPFDICLPQGGWYDYWTGLPVAKRKFSEAPRLESLPVFVRAGTILPRQPLVQSSAETPRGALKLDVYPGDDCRGELYFDDGISIGGASLRQEIRCRTTPAGLVLQFGPRAGTFRPWWKEIAVTVHGWRNATARVSDGTPATTDQRSQTTVFTIADQPGAKELTVGAGA
jgi:alpha-glucosidase